MKMRHARIYFQAQNLFTITGYTGADLKVWAILIRCPVRSLWDYHLVSKLLKLYYYEIETFIICLAQ